MTDWNWLWVIGEVGISYGFYRWWQYNADFVAALEGASQIQIDELRKLSSADKWIHYAMINGCVQPNDSKASSVIKSTLVPDCHGVIQRLITRERKLEKIREVWTTAKRTIADVTRSVPFRLQSAKGNFVQIDNPLKFDSIAYELETTHVKIDPKTATAMETFLQTFTGEVQTGIETKEEMLSVNIPLTGVGRLEKRSGIWFLIPHEKWGGILTRSSRDDIISRYQSKSSLFQSLTILFGVGAICTAIYLLHRYYDRQSRRTNPLQPNPPREEQQINHTEENVQLQCVVCSQNEVMYSLQPCSHLALCGTCAQDLQRRNETEQLCPTCQVRIREYQRVFLP